MLRPLRAAALALGSALAIASPGIAFAQAPPTTIKGERVVAADLVQIRGIVESVDMRERSVVLNVGDKGFRTIRVGPAARNLAQVRPGDIVEIDIYEETALVLARDAPQGERAADRVALAPVGGKPGGTIVRVRTATSRVMAIDTQSRQVTLRRSDGSLVEVRAPDDIDLSRVAVGDDVVAVHTEALVVDVRKP